MRGGAPGVARERLEASDGVDASNRLVCAHRSTRDRAKCHFTVIRLQLAKCVRTLFELGHDLLDWRSMQSDSILAIRRLD
jgi:hypothetical protein